jgi:hypothetical protein
MKDTGGGDAGSIASEVESALRARIVDEEQLLSDPEWLQAVGAGVGVGGGSGGGGGGGAGAGVAPMPRRQVSPKILEELVQLFPNKSVKGGCRVQGRV